MPHICEDCCDKEANYALPHETTRRWCYECGKKHGATNPRRRAEKRPAAANVPSRGGAKKPRAIDSAGAEDDVDI